MQAATHLMKASACVVIAAALLPTQAVQAAQSKPNKQSYQQAEPARQTKFEQQQVETYLENACSVAAYPNDDVDSHDWKLKTIKDGRDMLGYLVSDGTTRCMISVNSDGFLTSMTVAQVTSVKTSSTPRPKLKRVTIPQPSETADEDEDTNTADDQ